MYRHHPLAVTLIPIVVHPEVVASAVAAAVEVLAAVALAEAAVAASVVEVLAAVALAEAAVAAHEVAVVADNSPLSNS